MKPNHYAVIMAGGQGTRFWPWSTAACPKQFLPVAGEQPLLTQTWQRLARFIPADHIFIVADPVYLPAVRHCLPDFPTSQYIAEPCPRNTAPALILSAVALERHDRDAHVLVVPADHYIPEEEIFARQLQDALAGAADPCVITAGVRPSSPHTGYGYIQFKPDHPKRVGSTDFFTVEQFREKPDLPTATGFLQAGTFYWNSGMFIYHLAHFRRFFQEYSPYYHERWLAYEAAWENPAVLAQAYTDTRPDSIDYALMEKLPHVRMFEAAFTWNDVGSWSSVYEMGQADEQGNVQRGQTIAVDCRGSLLFSTTGRPLAAIGVQEMAIIETENGVLVAPRAELQRVREVLQRLGKK